MSGHLTHLPFARTEGKTEEDPITAISVRGFPRPDDKDSISGNLRVCTGSALITVMKLRRYTGNAERPDMQLGHRLYGFVFRKGWSSVKA